MRFLRRLRLLVALAITLLFQSPISPQSIVVPNGFGLGRDFVERNSEGYMDLQQQVAYARGFTNGLLASGLLKADEARLKALAECITGMTDHQIRAILEHDIRDNPKDWHRNLVALNMTAIGRACDMFRTTKQENQ